MLYIQTLSYNKYNLKPQTSEKQAKEILIRRQNTLRESLRKGQSLPWVKPVCGVDLSPSNWACPWGRASSAEVKSLTTYSDFTCYQRDGKTLGGNRPEQPPHLDAGVQGLRHL